MTTIERSKNVRTVVAKIFLTYCPAFHSRLKSIKMTISLYPQTLYLPHQNLEQSPLIHLSNQPGVVFSSIRESMKLARTPSNAFTSTCALKYSYLAPRPPAKARRREYIRGSQTRKLRGSFSEKCKICPMFS